MPRGRDSVLRKLAHLLAAQTQRDTKASKRAKVLLKILKGATIKQNGRKILLTSDE
jgi:hypothetical protein